MKPMATLGTSMWPAIKSGDLAFAEPANDFAPGDLVLIRVAGMELIHRYLAPSVVKGDRLNLRDSASDADFTMMKIKAVVPRRLARGYGKLVLLDPPPLYLRRLSHFQAWVSLRQSVAKSRIERRLTLAALLLNGWLLRLAMYQRSWNSKDTLGSLS